MFFVFYTVRILYRLVLAAMLPNIAPSSAINQRRRAWPWRCDNNLHINNATYLRLMEDGRIEWIVRLGIFQRLLRGKLRFVLAGMSMTYRREIRMFCPYRVETRLLDYDERWLFFEQNFYLEPEDGDTLVAARAIVRVQVRDPNGLISGEDFFQRCGLHMTKRTKLPSDFASWLQFSNDAVDVIREMDQLDDDED